MAIDTKQKRQSAMAVTGMPWEWGDDLFIDGDVSQEDRQHVVNVYTGILVEDLAADLCTKYGVKRYGTFSYCSHTGLRAYRVVFDEFGVMYLTDWNLQSPDGNIWTPTLTTGSNEAPVFTWVSSSGTKSTETPVVLEETVNRFYAMSIDNDGVVTYTGVALATGGAPSTAQRGAAMLDDNDKVWYFYVNRHGQFTLGDSTPYLTIPYMRKVQFELEYSPTSQAKASPVNEFICGRVGTDVAYRIPAWWRWWIPEVDFVQQTRTAIEFEITASEDVNIREVVARTQTQRLKRRR